MTGRLIDADKLDIYDVSPAYGMCVIGCTEEDIADAPTVEAIPIEWIKKWMVYQNSWTTEGVTSLLRDWAERRTE